MRSRKQSGKRAGDEVNVYQCSNAMTTLSSSCLKLCSECVQEATAILKQLYNGPQTWLVKQPIQHALRVASVAATFIFVVSRSSSGAKLGNCVMTCRRGGTRLDCRDQGDNSLVPKSSLKPGNEAMKASISITQEAKISLKYK